MPEMTGLPAVLGLWLGAMVTVTPYCARAQGADLSGAESCVAAALAAGSSPADCLGQMHAPCLAFPQNATAQATLCFVETRKDWDTRTKAALEAMAAQPDPMIGRIAAIESRYELLTNLLQCDRLDELSALYAHPDEARLLQKTRCEAAAAGLTYIRLLVRAGGAP